jgi:hypothetical protein
MTASTDESWVLPFLAEVSNGRFIKGKGGGGIRAQTGPIFGFMTTAVQNGERGLLALIPSLSPET